MCITQCAQIYLVGGVKRMQQQQMMQGQTATGNVMPSSNMQQKMNHGGHEVFDVHEILAGYINVLDQFVMFNQFVQDQELQTILNRQHQFILEHYNITVEAFSTGQDPSKPTGQYKMQQDNTIIYGIKPSQPKKPIMSTSEVNDHGISGHMLGLIKSTASLLAMTSLEITNPVVRRVVADSVPNFIEMAYEIFLWQNKNHFYQVPQLTAQDTNSMVSSFATVPMQPLQ
jgi:spore coat protein CotF